MIHSWPGCKCCVRRSWGQVLRGWQVTEQDPTALATEYTKATKLQLLWFWHDYLVLAIQRLRNKTRQLPPWGGARSCSLSSSFKVQSHLSWRPSQFSVFWGQIKERKKKFKKVFLVATCPNNVLRTTLPVKLTSSLCPDTNVYSLFEHHQKVISGNKSWSIICWQADCSKYEIFKTQNSCYMTYSLAEESNLML